MYPRKTKRGDINKTKETITKQEDATASNVAVKTEGETSIESVWQKRFILTAMIAAHCRTGGAQNEKKELMI